MTPKRNQRKSPRKVKTKKTGKKQLLNIPSDSDSDEFLLTQMTRKYGGDEEEAQGEEATQDTQASQATQATQSKPKHKRPRRCFLQPQ